MRRLLVAALLLLAPALARADNITITISGSQLAGLSAAQSVSYSISDSDLQNVLNWATTAFASCLTANYGGGPYTNPQIMACWVQNWLAIGTKNAVVQFLTPAPVAPTPPTLTPGSGAPTQNAVSQGVVTP